jgi:hypothetical protein
MSLASPSTFEYLSLNFRADLHLLVLRWLRDVNLAELQAGFAEAQALAQEYRAYHWFVDVRRRGALSASDSAWVADVLLPQMARQLEPSVFAIAYLLAPFRAKAIQKQGPMQATVARAQASTQPYRLRTFLDEAEAVEWLQIGG